jgi:hypothetical protein
MPVTSSSSRLGWIERGGSREPAHGALGLMRTSKSGQRWRSGAAAATALVSLGAALMIPVTAVAATEAEPVVYDGGAVFPLQEVTHTFELANPGTSPWNVLQVRTTCSCAVVSAIPAVVPPGGRIAIPVVFHPHASIDAAASSTVRVHVRGEGIDVEYPFIIQATPQLPVDGPERVTISAAAPTQEFLIRHGRHPAPWNTLRANLASGAEFLTIDNAVPQGDAWKIVIHADVARWSGVMIGRAALECLQDGIPLPYHPDVTIVVRCDGRMRAMPASVLFSAVRIGEVAAASVRIIAPQFDLSQAIARTGNPHCHVAFDPVASMLSLEFHADGQPAMANSWVELAAGGERLRIPYIAAVVQAESAPQP